MISKLIIEIILTIVQTDVGSPSTKSLFPGKPTEGVQAVVEIHIDDRFAEFDRTLDESAAVVRRSVTEGPPSTEDPLRILSWRISFWIMQELTTTTGSLFCSVIPTGRNTFA